MSRRKKVPEHPGIILSDPVKRERYEKNFKKLQKYRIWEENITLAINEFYNEVNLYLNNYMQQPSQQYYMMFNFFNGLDNFFLDAQKNICHIDGINGLFHPNCRRLCFNENNYIKVFQDNFLLPYPPPDSNVIIKLRQVLALRKETGDFWTYQRFKQKTNCLQSIYDYVKDFFLFDDNLAVLLNNKMLYLLHEKSYKVLVQEYNLTFSDRQPQPNRREFRAIARILKNNICDYHRENILGCRKRHKQTLMNEIIAHLQKNNEKFVSKITLDDICRQSDILKNKVTHSSNLKNIEEFLNTHSDEAPVNVAKYISMLTNGNIKVIDQLARMIALINLEKKIKPKMFGIVASNLSVFSDFINLFYIDQLEVNYATVKKMKSIEHFISVIELNYLALMITVIVLYPSSTLDLDEEYFKTLKKMILSKAIQKKDKRFGDFTYINRTICIAPIKTHSEQCKYQEYLGDEIEIINLGNIAKEKFSEIQINEDDYWWMHVIFATYGLMLLHKRQKEEETYDSQRIVRQFIECCCIISPKVDCYKEDFYQDFVRFFKAQFDVEPMKKGQLENIVKMYYKITDTRPRHAADDNRRGLKGIAIDKNKLNDYLDCISTNKQNLDIQKGIEYLNTINKTVVKLLGG